MLKSVERLLEFVGDMNATEINDHIKARPDGIAVSFGIDGEWLDGWNRAVLATVEKIEKEVAERYVELPKNADGVPIRVGDVLTDGEYKFKVFELAAFGDGSWSIRNEDGDAWEACDVTHHHEPTVEDVLRDMHAKLDEVIVLYVGEAIDSDEARIFAEYAQRLQLREVDE